MLTGLSGLSGLSGLTGGNAASPPTAPRSLAAVPDGDSFLISWLAPLSNGGSAITGYNVYVNNVLFGGNGLSLSIDMAYGDMPPGELVEITAVNAIGESARAGLIVPNFPAAPQDLDVTVVNDTDVVIDWSSLGSDGGSAITDYKIYFDDVYFDNTGDGATTIYNTTTASCPDGTAVTLTAVNAVGEGPPCLPDYCEAPFGPGTISNLEVDIDPGNSVNVILNGGVIEQVNDMSGKNRHATQATPGNRGIIKTANLNGYDVMSFAAGKSIATPASVLSTWDAANAGSLYLVCKYTNPADYAAIIDTVNRHISLMTRYTTGQFIYCTIGAGPPLGTPTTGIVPINQWNIISLVVPNNSLSSTDLFSNGTWSGVKIHGGSTFSDPIVLGLNASGSAANPLGDYARLLVYSNVHTTGQRQQIEGYLAHRYGLTGNLPGDHPYKTVAP